MIDPDQEHLRLLSIGHYILAGMTALFSLFALLYVGFGALVFPALFLHKHRMAPIPASSGIVSRRSVLECSPRNGNGRPLFCGGPEFARSPPAYLLPHYGWSSCFYFPYGTVLGVGTLIGYAGLRWKSFLR